MERSKKRHSTFWLKPQLGVSSSMNAERKLELAVASSPEIVKFERSQLI